MKTRVVLSVLFWLIVLSLAPLTWGQRNEVTGLVIADLNAHDYPVTLGVNSVNPVGIIGSNRSAIAGGVEYQRSLNPIISVGAVFDGGPSDGKLQVPAWYERQTTYIWPMTEYKLLAMVTERAPHFGKWTPWLSEGFGMMLTDGYANSGWTAEPALAFGPGVDYQINKRWSARVGDRWILTRIGCYGDPTCGEKFQEVDQEFEIGITYKWGKISPLIGRR